MQLTKVVQNITYYDDAWCFVHMHQHAFKNLPSIFKGAKCILNQNSTYAFVIFNEVQLN
jgi:hypothetical protein